MILSLPSQTLAAFLAARWDWELEGCMLRGPGSGEFEISSPGPNVRPRSLRVPADFQIEAVAEIATWYTGQEERDYRRARESDLPEVLRLYEDIARESFQSFLDEEQTKIKLEEGSRRIENLLRNEILFLARLQGDPWAICGLQEDGLLLAAYSRGLQAGATLSLQLLSLAADSGFREVRGIISRGNTPAQRAFSRIGLQPTGRESLSAGVPLEEWAISLEDWL